MWILVIITVLSTDPLKVMYDPVAKFSTLDQCDKTAELISRHNKETRLVCVKDSQ